MNKLITLLALTMFAAGAQAAAFVDLASVQPDDFVNAYTLNSFDIGAGSKILPESPRISSGVIQLDKSTNQMRLVLNRRFYCPPGSMCPMIMPLPVTMTLPIVFNKSGMCGLTLTTAEGLVNNEMVTVQITDDSNDTCQTARLDKKVQVEVTEEITHGTSVISNLSGSSLTLTLTR